MDYPRALQYVLSFADYERASTSRVKYRDFNLKRVREMLRRLGNPHLVYPSVHIAGTKGKGSTVAMVASILTTAGYKTGQYTSPHLHTVRERIAMDGEPISERDFAQRVTEVRQVVDMVNADPVLGPVTVFEVLTVLAFLHFRRAGAHIAVVEVGLGGRLDATNVLTPRLCAITNISLDHTEVLGDTLAKIAEEKAGIIKPGVPVVVSAQQPEALEAIVRIAQAKGAPLVNAGRDTSIELLSKDITGQELSITTVKQTYRVRLPLLGDFQRENAATAIAICETLAGLGATITPEAIVRGLSRVKWPARVEVVAQEPLVIVDGAHNPYSIARLRESLQHDFTYANAHLIFGVNRTKDLGGMVAALKGLPGDVIATASQHPKAVPAQEVAQALASGGILAITKPDTAAALAYAKSRYRKGDLIIATGSLFIAGEVREAVLGIIPDAYPASSPTAI